MQTEIEAARALTWRAARLKAGGAVVLAALVGTGARTVAGRRR